MMQKDETILLEPWLRYHGYLFGFENLFVFDNGSTDAATIGLLEEFAGFGVNVRYDHATGGDFDCKGEIAGELIRAFQQDRRYDVALPLDCDEFVLVLGATGISIARDEILEQLANLAKPGQMVKIGDNLVNRPGLLDLFELKLFDKSVVPIGDFRSIDHGFHEALSNVDPGDYQSCKLCYVHLHYKPIRHVLRHARDKLNPFVNVDDVQALHAFSGTGRHLARYFFMSEPEYYLNFDPDYPYPFVRYTRFRDFIHLLMASADFERTWQDPPERAAQAERLLRSSPVVDMSGPFDTAAYARANADVGDSGMNPVVHYCLFGYQEGRPLGR